MKKQKPVICSIPNCQNWSHIKSKNLCEQHLDEKLNKDFGAKFHKPTLFKEYCFYI